MDSDQKALRLRAIFIFLLVAGLWAYFLFFVPTFDLDESLYRRAAEEMKWSGHWWIPTWDANPLYHKPPLLYWMMIVVSNWVDGATAPISIFSARLPSVLASSGILWALFSFSKKIQLKKPLHAPLFFCAAILPLLTAPSAIFDPVQTFFLLPTLFIPTLWFQEKRDGTVNEFLVFGLSLFFATALKGLNGLLIPCFAFGLHQLFQIKEIGVKASLLKVTRFALKVFLPATLLSFLWYWFLDQKMGRSFTTEFFLVHHFGRSSEAMESHGGSLFYHPFVVLLGAGFLCPFILQAWATRRPSFLRWGFPLTYAFSFVFAFSFVATKLPHYTWPVWPALALACAVFTDLPLKENEAPVSRQTSFLFALPVLILASILLFLTLDPVFLVRQFSLSEPALVYLKYFDGFNLIEKICFGMGSLLCWFFLYARKKLIQDVKTSLVFAVLVSVFLTAGLMPSIISLWIQPYYGVIAEIRKSGILPNECIRYNGQHSPSLSLALGQDLVYNKHCEPEAANFLITPEWKLAECEKFGMHVVAQEKYLFLCKR